jgi:uncharacterized protein YdhG (YjbR/CyaY superfamily)
MGFQPSGWKPLVKNQIHSDSDQIFLTMHSAPIYKTIDEYILLQTGQHQDNLKMIRQTIKAAVPEALEVISYQMPSFKYFGMLCYFAVFKDHYSLFVSPAVRDAFSKDLVSYKTTKSAIHLPFNRPIPVKLIEEIIRFAAITNLGKAEAKKEKKK